jgi:hypothetical protein
MQYFLGYSSFNDEEPFDPSLFVDFRKRLGIDQINEINEKILEMPKGKDKDSLPPEEPNKQEKVKSRG